MPKVRQRSTYLAILSSEATKNLLLRRKNRTSRLLTARNGRWECFHPWVGRSLM
jgi:hypothetical protein